MLTLAILLVTGVRFDQDARAARALDGRIDAPRIGRIALRDLRNAGEPNAEPNPTIFKRPSTGEHFKHRTKQPRGLKGALLFKGSLKVLCGTGGESSTPSRR